ncbi:pentatricopeptide repeat protein [Plectosphaerella cucumerina]|uniref:Pentatricopeptide repeat protein n=1 Tax=Plectosphaerella cucumerina TaxID=40658 RepID=A0A8K0X046_9PEZI|nr:pentatricopeptide repeat protein [Plectosphaerella cucumerina]
MFTCIACLRRNLLLLSRTAPRNLRLQATYAPQLRLTQTSGPRLFSTSNTADLPISAGTIRASPTHSFEEADDSVAEKKQQKKLRFAVGKHLERLNDPWNIAQHVERTLRQTGDSRFDEVLLLVQTASKNTPVTVSWNHLIDHHFKMKRLRPAIKLFNEMKKRGQKPNQQTYTIIFRGCAENPHKDLALTEAVRIYNSMSKDGAVRPNLIHANAVLHVCVRAGDMDAMFAFLDKMDDNKQLRMDSSSYSTILQGMRLQLESVQNSTEESPSGEREEAAGEIIGRCETIWGEIVRKWRKGALRFDESLVATMGRLLLHGQVRNQRNIFALLQQTMDLPRFDQNETASSKPTSPDGQPASVYKPFSIPDNSRISPDTRTLDLILEATTKMRLVKVGVRYWQHLVNELRIVPDRDNWLKLLKLLHLGSSSTETAKFLAAMPSTFITTYTLRTALSTCLRNMQNPNVLANAHAILLIILREARDGTPDSKSLWLYLQVLNGRMAALHKETSERRRVICQEAASSLEAMWEPYGRASDAVHLPRLVAERQMPFKDAGRVSQLGQVVDVAREMISVTSKILPHVDSKSQAALEKRRSSLNRQVVAFTEVLPGSEESGAKTRADRST